MERINSRGGCVEVITGSMFSGKTEELIRRIRRAQIARMSIQIFKPKIDNRYSEKEVASHNKSTIQAEPVENSLEIFKRIKPVTQVVAIDEVQFFDDGIIEVCQKLADQGIRVVAAGLDTDWKGEPFGPMPQLLCIAEYVKKQHAICMVCGALASRTQRIKGGTESVEVGANESYEARCRLCYVPPKKDAAPSVETESDSSSLGEKEISLHI